MLQSCVENEQNLPSNLSRFEAEKLYDQIVKYCGFDYILWPFFTTVYTIFENIQPFIFVNSICVR